MQLIYHQSDLRDGIRKLKGKETPFINKFDALMTEMISAEKSFSPSEEMGNIVSEEIFFYKGAFHE